MAEQDFYMCIYVIVCVCVYIYIHTHTTQDVWTTTQDESRRGHVRLSRARAARQDGATPVYIASQNGHLEVVKYLAERAPDTLAVALKVRARMGGARTHTAEACARLRHGAMAPTEARRRRRRGPCVH